MRRLICILLILMMMAPAAMAESMPGWASAVVSETNRDRAKAGLHPLVLDASLSAAACVRAQEIVKKFSHIRPNGQRGVSIYPSAKAENIAKGQQYVAKVMAAWMSSAGHKRNILRRSSTKIGVYAYRHNGIMYWVQLFN